MPSNREIIILAAMAIGLLLKIFIQKQKESKWLEEAQQRQKTRFEYLNGTPRQNSKITKIEPRVPKDGYPGKQKWYPTGWVFNEETQLWDPPDYLNSAPKDKLARYKEYHKNRPPTFEEWKAEREKQQQNST